MRLMCCPFFIWKMTYSAIGDEGARELANAMRHRFQLHQQSMGAQTDSMWPLTLKRLHLGMCAIEVAGIKALAQALPFCPRLEELDLTSNSSGDEGTVELAKVLGAGGGQHLIEVNLRGNEIGEEGARALATTLLAGGGAALKRLILKDNDLGGEAGLVELRNVVATRPELMVMASGMEQGGGGLPGLEDLREEFRYLQQMMGGF